MLGVFVQIFLFSFLLSPGLFYHFSGGAGEAYPKPNVLLILADDLGWNNVSCYGNTYLQTSNIDRLAREGIKFNQAYVTPQCTPTRASLLTGQHTARVKMWHVIPKYEFPNAYLREPEYSELLSPDNLTLGDVMHAAGYRTALFGKWHLTNPESGIGDYVGLYPEHAADYGFDAVAPLTTPPGYHQHGDKGVDFLTDQTIEFIRSDRTAPFFVLLSHHTIHGEVLAPDALVDEYLKKGFSREGQHNATYMAALKHLDNSVGRLLEVLDQDGLAENTVVIFMSDNGGVDARFDNQPLREGKGTLYEGGIRTPLLIRYPKVIKPGLVNNQLIQVADLLPTLADLAGLNPKKYATDGLSFRPIFHGKNLPERPLYWYAPLYDILWGTTPAAAIRQGEYKLIVHFGDYIDLSREGAYETQKLVELYDIENDISETVNLASDNPKIVSELSSKLTAWMKQLHLELPRPNPNYDQSKALVRGQKMNK